MTVILLTATLPLLVVWFFIPENNMKVDWVLLRDFEQAKKWYVFDTVWHLQNIIQTFLIWRLSKMIFGKTLGIITLVFFCFAIFRILEYYLVHNIVPMLPFILGISMFSLGYYFTKK